jgi:hypothetical protein
MEHRLWLHVNCAAFADVQQLMFGTQLCDSIKNVECDAAAVQHGPSKRQAKSLGSSGLLYFGTADGCATQIYGRDNKLFPAGIEYEKSPGDARPP